MIVGVSPAVVIYDLDLLQLCSALSDNLGLCVDLTVPCFVILCIQLPTSNKSNTDMVLDQSVYETAVVCQSCGISYRNNWRIENWFLSHFSRFYQHPDLN